MNLAVVILAAGASTRMGRPKLLLPWGDGTVLSHIVTTWRQLGAAQIAVVIAPAANQTANGQGAARPSESQDPERGAPAPRVDGNQDRAELELGAPNAVLGHEAGFCPENALPGHVREMPVPQLLAAELDRLAINPRERIENPHPELGMFSSVRCAAQWSGWQPTLTHWLLTLGDQPHVQTTTLRALLDFAAHHADNVCQPARNGRPRHPVLLPRAVFRELTATSAGDLKQFLLARPAERACFESGDAGLDFDLDTPADYERASLKLSPRPEPPGCS